MNKRQSKEEEKEEEGGKKKKEQKKENGIMRTESMSMEELREQFMKDNQKASAMPSISFVLPPENKEKEILSSYVDNKLEFDRYIQLKDYIESEKFKINEQLAEIPVIEEDTEEMIIRKEDIIKSLKENWEFLTNAERRMFLIKFVDKIMIMNEMQNSRRGVIKITDVKFNTD